MRTLYSCVLFAVFLSCTRVQDRKIVPESLPYKANLIRVGHQPRSLCMMVVGYDSLRQAERCVHLKFSTDTAVADLSIRALCLTSLAFNMDTDQITFKRTEYADVQSIVLLPPLYDVNGNGTLDYGFLLEYADRFVVQYHDHAVNSNQPLFRSTIYREDGHYVRMITLWQQQHREPVLVFVKSNRLVWQNAKSADTLLFCNGRTGVVERKVPVGFYANPYARSSFYTRDSLLVLLGVTSMNGHHWGGFDDYHGYIVALRSDGSTAWADTIAHTRQGSYVEGMLTTNRHRAYAAVRRESVPGRNVRQILRCDTRTGKVLDTVLVPEDVLFWYPVPKANGNILMIGEDFLAEADTTLRELKRVSLPIPCGESDGFGSNTNMWELVSTSLNQGVDINNDGVEDIVLHASNGQVLVIDGATLHVLLATHAFQGGVNYALIRAGTLPPRLAVLEHSSALFLYSLAPTPLHQRIGALWDRLFAIGIVLVVLPVGVIAFRRLLYLRRLFSILASTNQGVVIFVQRRYNGAVFTKEMNARAADILHTDGTVTELSRFPLGIRTAVEQCLHTAQHQEHQIAITTHQTVYLAVNVEPMRLWGLFRMCVLTITDATALVKSEMVSLALVIAHSAKNELAFIQSQVENLMETLRLRYAIDELSLHRAEQKIADSIAEVVEVLHKLLYAVDIPEEGKMWCSLHSVIEEWIEHKGVRYTRWGVCLDSKVEKNLPLLYMEKRYFCMLLDCACDNAVQAMHEKQKPYSIAFHATQQGNVLLFTIVDNGKGMSPETREQLGSPYFSTKPSGTGVGMRLIRKVCELHNATIRVESTPETGTTLLFSFPLGDVSHVVY